MKRAIRRHYVAKIKKLISREIEEINTRYDQPRRWGKPNPARDETRKQQAVRYAYRDEGRYARRKAASGRGHICGCEWCVSNWTFSSQKEIARINDEEQDYINLGFPPDWGCTWSEMWDWSDEPFEDIDWSWDFWYNHEQWNYSQKTKSVSIGEHLGIKFAKNKLI
jgi:hypothetical protein